MDALGRGVDWGSMLSLVDGLLWPAKLPPSGVDFRPVCHHPHRGSVSPGEGGFEEILPPSPSQRHNCTSPVARYQLPDPQSGKSGYSNPEYVHLEKLEDLMCLHGKPDHISPRVDKFQNWGSLHALAEGSRVNQAPSHAGRTNGSVVFHGGSPYIGCSLAETRN